MRFGYASVVRVPCNGVVARGSGSGRTGVDRGWDSDTLMGGNITSEPDHYRSSQRDIPRLELREI